MIGVLRIGYGNTQSIVSLLDRLGYDYSEIECKEDISEQITHLIIPGVGGYSEGSVKLVELGLDVAILEFAESGKPLLGICLGMQLLTTRGYENGVSDGLNLIDAETRILSTNLNDILPHMGWNSVNFIREHPVFKGIKSGVDFYFAHTYSVQGIDKNNIQALTTYTVEFPSVIASKNIIGVQFHPEKSLKNGIKMIDNFCQWDGQC